MNPQAQARIYGQLVDDAGRCVHYHSRLDILGNLCGACQHYYACFQCHAARTDHDFGRISRAHPAGLCCGKCGVTFSYGEYAGTSCTQGNLVADDASAQFAPACPQCRAPMNPGCQLHAHLYYLD
ncbi:MAG: hypothetical protein Q3976_03415 [Corynebacterium sp.]|nr:hypothetical protein [Corynebacterium sp.]